jgi:simple sugar transport system permease protein
MKSLRLAKSASSMLLAWGLAMALTSVAVWLVGEKPIHVLKVLGVSAAGGLDNFSYTLFYATPLLLTGASVALALEAGLFNIGAEGQLYAGAVAAAAWGALTRHWFGVPKPMLAVFVVLTGAAIAFAAGAAWGALAGYLRTRRNVHEVIATIMLNFVALAFANWAILNPLKNTDTQNSETVWIAEALRIPRMWNQATWGLPIALAIGIGVLWAIKGTWWGFRVRATGKSESAARLAGVDVGRTSFTAMAVSGGIAGLAGFHEVFFCAYRLIDGFSPGYGFTGLAIALLARGSPAMLIASALLFGALHKGALDLDLETEKVTRDLSAVIQALILVALAAQPWLAGKISALVARRRRAS